MTICMPRKPKRVLREGDVCGEWTVIKPVTVTPKPGKRRYSRHICRCVCGNESSVLTHSLLNGTSTQCQKCRSKKSQKVYKDGVLVAIRIPLAYKHFLESSFAGARPVGQGIRESVKLYRASGSVAKRGRRDYLTTSETPYTHTSVVLSPDDKNWLKANHESLIEGILLAIDYYLFKDLCSTTHS